MLKSFERTFLRSGIHIKHVARNGGRNNGPGWKSQVVVVVLVAGVFLLAMRNGPSYRDRYRSLEECRRDWANIAGQSNCAAVTHGGVRMILGPLYEENARPRTAAPASRIEAVEISRGGFGRSGAMYTAGG